MSWVKLDDGFLDHPKVVAAGGDATWLYVCGLLYAARHLTDGHIPAAMVARLSDRAKAGALAERLVAVGLWERAAGGYSIHDYADWNPSAATIAERRAQDARRHQQWQARRNGASNGVNNAVSNDVSHG